MRGYFSVSTSPTTLPTPGWPTVPMDSPHDPLAGRSDPLAGPLPPLDGAPDSMAGPSDPLVGALDLMAGPQILLSGPLDPLLVLWNPGLPSKPLAGPLDP